MLRYAAVNWPVATNLVFKTAVVGVGLWAVSTPSTTRNLAHGLVAYLILTIWCYLDRMTTPNRWGRCLIIALLLYLAAVQVAHLLLLWSDGRF